MTELPFCYMSFKFMMSGIPEKKQEVKSDKHTIRLGGDVGDKPPVCS